MAARSLLDTDTLSQYLRGRNPLVRQRTAEYLAHHHRLSFSLMTRCEIVRGLKARGAARRLQDFALFCAANEILPITDDAIVRAADLYALLRQRGELLPDADLFIASGAGAWPDARYLQHRALPADSRACPRLLDDALSCEGVFWCNREF